MSKRLSLRLLAIPLILAVFILGVQVVAHYDGNDHDEAHCTCQVCHVAHAAIPQPAAHVAFHTALFVASYLPIDESAFAVDVLATPAIPRAPPA